MKFRKALFLIAAVLVIAALSAAPALSQATDQKKMENTVTIKGKIEYSKKLGGYYVHGEEPGGEFMIMNPAPPVLKKLMKQKKTVTVEGTLKGSEYITINKIDGMDYRAKAGPEKMKESGK